MLKEMPMRMFLSSTERRNVLREPKEAPDVSIGFRPPYWSPSEGLQHGVSILNTIIFSDTSNNSSSEHRTSPKLWHVVCLLLFYDISISWLNL